MPYYCYTVIIIIIIIIQILYDGVFKTFAVSSVKFTQRRAYVSHFLSSVQQSDCHELR
jgi:hypothetical protein